MRNVDMGTLEIDERKKKKNKQTKQPLFIIVIKYIEKFNVDFVV